MLVERITEDKGRKCCKKRYENDVAHGLGQTGLGLQGGSVVKEKFGPRSPVTDGYRHFRGICQLFCKYSQNGTHT